MQGLLSSLRVRLVLLVAIAMLPAFGLILWTSLDQRRNERKDVEENAVQFTESVAAQQEQVVANARDLASGLASAPQVLGTDRAGCSAFLADISSVERRYAGFGMADPSGNILCSSVKLPGPVSVSDRDYFQQVLQTHQFAVSGYQVAKVVNKPSMNFGYPILDGAGRLSGVVTGGVTLDWLNAYLARLSLPSDAILIVIDPAGIVLARQPDPEVWVGKPVGETQVGRTVLSEGEGSAEMTGLDGKQRLFAFAPLGGAARDDAYVAVGLSTASAYAPITHTLVRNMSLLGGVTALALVAAWFGGNGLVVRKVNVVLAAAQRVMGGDLGARTGLTGEGELGRLGHGFDEMASALQEREAERALAEGELARQAEALARSNAELEQFAYVASHDLQEPLRMVASYTQLLAKRYEGKLDSEADEFIHYAVDGANRMQVLINDLLALSRVGMRGAALEESDVEQAFEACVRNLEMAIEESGAAVTHDPLPAVLADEGQLVQLLQNLIANAIKFHGDEPPRIHVSARREGAQYVFSVRDNGIGIEPQYAEGVFVLFRRLHGKDAYPGTGIGLAICKKIVERHGGRIWFESEPGKGATFSFTLSAAPAGILVAA